MKGNETPAHFTAYPGPPIGRLENVFFGAPGRESRQAANRSLSDLCLKKDGALKCILDPHW